MILNMILNRQSHLKNVPIIYLPEPVSDWESIIDTEGKNIIEKYYANQEKYAFSFQMMAYISRLSLLRKAFRNDKYKIIITERSVFTDKNIFCKMLYDADKIEEINYTIKLFERI